VSKFGGDPAVGGPSSNDNSDCTKITPGTGSHIYHQHINSFQLVSVPNLTLTDDVARIGEWRDVMYSFSYGATVRQKPVDFLGDVVVHCHMLQHEDMGMMALYRIVDPQDVDYVCTSPPAPAPSPSAPPPSPGSRPPPPPGNGPPHRF
jgi:hypothetical protein